MPEVEWNVLTTLGETTAYITMKVLLMSMGVGFLLLARGTHTGAYGAVFTDVRRENGYIADPERSARDAYNGFDFRAQHPAEVIPKIYTKTREKRASGNGGDESLSQRDIVLIGSGGAVLLIASLAVCGICCCKKRKSSRTKLENQPDGDENAVEGTMLTSASHNEDRMNGSTTTGSKQQGETQKLLTDKNLPNDKPIETGELSSEPSDIEGQMRLPIPKGQIANAVQKLARTDDGYKNEFEALTSSGLASVDHSQIDANKPKNRFKNILPYDHSLVVLKEGDHYINASYITGYGSRGKAYIATQGPLESTMEAFWRMIWQEGCGEIIMLANLMENNKKKCSQYWPDEGKSVVYGSFTVQNENEVEEPLKYTVRKFELEKEGVEEKRIVRQYHFTAWGDMTDINSATPIWEILKQLRAERVQSDDTESDKNPPPIVVHCSAGCGRTGTVITLDVMRIMMKRDNQVDIFNFVNQMRSERMNMVQVESQYRFIYESVLIYMRVKRTCFPPAKFVEKLGEWEVPAGESTLSALQKQYHLYAYLHPQKTDTSFAGGRPNNADKNRDSSKIPDDINRPLLQTPVPDDDTSTNYINACFFNGRTKRSRFIATQAPMQNTYTDLWRMLFDYKSETIVGFQGDDREKFPAYWPSDTAELGPFAIENTGEEVVSDNLTIRDFELRKVSEGSEKNQKNTRAIRQYCINGFDDMAPDQQVILLVDLVTKHVRPRMESSPETRLTVHCEFGIGMSGVLIALFNAIDMLMGDNQVDVFTIVKLLRMCRHDIIDTFEKYKLLNDAVKYYIQNPTEETPDATSDDEEEGKEEPVYANVE